MWLSIAGPGSMQIARPSRQSMRYELVPERVSAEGLGARTSVTRDRATTRPLTHGAARIRSRRIRWA